MNPANYSTISLFGIEMNPPRGFEIGPMNIRLYGIVIAVDDILDGVLGIVPFAIICARLYYCAFSWSDYKSNPISILYIWEGGLAIYGGVIGAAIGVVVFSLIKKVKLGAVLDLVAVSFLIGQSIGRWGNFFNREAFGAATDGLFKMGLLNSVSGKMEYYHPTFLYESLWNGVGFVLLHLLHNKRKYDGHMALCYVMWYGLGRTFIEGLRVDSLYLGTFRVSQLLAAVSCFVAATLLAVMMFVPHDPKKLFVNQVAQKEAKQAAGETTEE